MSDYIVYKSRLKQISFVLMGIFLILISVGGGTAGWQEKSWGYVLLGALGVVFFSFFEFSLIRMFFTGNELLILTDKGFYDFSSIIATRGKLIPWSSVQMIQIIHTGGWKYVSVYLKDSEAFAAPQSRLRRMINKSNLNGGFGMINITLQLAKHRDDDEVLKQMEDRLGEYRKQGEKHDEVFR